MEQALAKQLIREVLEEAWISEYVSPEVIAKRTELHPGTVRKWCRTGELKATKFKTEWRIKVKDWQNFCKKYEC